MIKRIFTALILSFIALSGIMMVSAVDYTENDVSQHNTRQDCWVIVDGKVYDITGITSTFHPDVINCGYDNTALYFARHGSLNNINPYQIGTLAVAPVDSDGDGVPDVDDAFPNDPNETTDSDGDGVGDNADAFPNNPNETTDSDGDGVGDNADAFPNNPNETTDSDGDGIGDNSDVYPNDPTNTDPNTVDTDGDGIPDVNDAFPNNPTEWTDTDGDGIGDNSDVYPNDPTRWEQEVQTNVTMEELASHNGPDSCWVAVLGNVYDVTPVLPDYGYFYTCGADNTEAWLGSIFGNDTSIMNPYIVGALAVSAPVDSDGDGIVDSEDAFPNNPNETTDSDGDGVGDNADFYPNDPTRWEQEIVTVPGNETEEDEEDEEEIDEEDNEGNKGNKGKKHDPIDKEAIEDIKSDVEELLLKLDSLDDKRLNSIEKLLKNVLKSLTKLLE